MIAKEQIARIEGMAIEDVAMRLGLRVERHKCLCPFHDDSHPSLTFNGYRNRYRCYVCEAHGGVIDLVMRCRGVGFKEAIEWASGESVIPIKEYRSARPSSVVPLDVEWLSCLVRLKKLNKDAQRFLYEERKIDPRVVAWCGLSSISTSEPCWRYGKPFYDAPSLLIPYYDKEGKLLSVQSRYLGSDEKPRFKFPRGSDCHIYNLPILRMLKPQEELWITEGCSDCWAMLSSGHKSIAIPSATLLKEEDIQPLLRLHEQLGISFHMYPDQDTPGEKLFMELFDRLPQLERHQLPAGYKDFGDYWNKICHTKTIS